MKLNRFIALTAMALLIVGAMGAIATRSFALGSHSPVAQVSAQSDACAQDQADGAEVTSAADTDNVELQCGDQNALDSGTPETVSAADTDTQQVEQQVGDQTGSDAGAEAPETASPSGN